MSLHDDDSNDILMQKRANYIDIPGRSDQFSLIEYLESVMSDRDLERNAEGGRVNKSFGGAILKAIGSGAKGLLDRFNRTTDDIVSKPFEINVPFGKVQTYKTKPMSTKVKVPLKLAGLFNTANAYHAHKLDHFY